MSRTFGLSPEQKTFNFRMMQSQSLNCIRSYHPDITDEDITLLKFSTSESLELPFSWLISTCMSFIWEERLRGMQAKLDKCKADMVSKLNLLKYTKWKYYTLHNSALLLEDMINLHFVY